MNEHFFGGFLTGIAFVAVIIGIFQIGLSSGIRVTLAILEKYPEARQTLIDAKPEMRVLPFVQSKR